MVLLMAALNSDGILWNLMLGEETSSPLSLMLTFFLPVLQLEFGVSEGSFKVENT